jgi:hypothetical protein
MSQRERERAIEREERGERREERGEKRDERREMRDERASELDNKRAGDYTGCAVTPCSKQIFLQIFSIILLFHNSKPRKWFLPIG